MGKNFSRIQQFRAALDEAFRKMTCKRKLQKPKVQKNSEDISSTESGPYIESHTNDDIYQSYGYQCDGYGPINYGYGTNGESIYDKYRYIYEDDYLTRTKRRPSTGSNFSKIPIVSYSENFIFRK